MTLNDLVLQNNESVPSFIQIAASDMLIYVIFLILDLQVG